MGVGRGAWAWAWAWAWKVQLVQWVFVYSMGRGTYLTIIVLYLMVRHGWMAAVECCGYSYSTVRTNCIVLYVYESECGTQRCGTRVLVVRQVSAEYRTVLYRTHCC